MEAELASKMPCFFKKFRCRTKGIVSVGLYSKEHQMYQNLNMEVQWLLMVMTVKNMYVQEYQQQINITRLFKKL
jgi:hypothetical protein